MYTDQKNREALLDSLIRAIRVIRGKTFSGIFCFWSV